MDSKCEDCDRVGALDNAKSLECDQLILGEDGRLLADDEGWDALTEAEQNAAMVLGITQKTWCYNCRYDVDI